MKLLPPIPMSDNCVILFWLLLLLTSINLIYFAESGTLLKNESDRLALLAFKDGISDDPNGVLSSWNNSHHFCMWHGVTCSRRHPQRVVALDLSYQSLRGSLLPHIGNLSFLKTIKLYNNTLEGHIPQEIGRLFRLQYLELINNSLDGEIPNNLTNCLQLRFLSLYGNKLVGNIPLDIGSLSKLYWLSLAKNNLIGHIPPSLWNLSSLTNLYLYDNSLDGSIPQELGRLAKLQYLEISENSFDGEIPKNLTRCLQLEAIYFGNNKLVGNIPLDIGSLSKLCWLNLEKNNLIGHIPPSLGNLSSLTNLYLSENRLNGRIPKELGRLVNLQWLAIRQNKHSVSILGNAKLCGGIPKLQLPKCPKQNVKKQERPFSRRVIITIVAAVGLFSFLLLCFLVFWSKKLREKLASTYSMRKSFLTVTYGELFKATDGFSSANLIGEGSYSHVYKGIIHHMEMVVAIKVLRLQQRRASKSFIAECKALRSIRHRNIVRILTVCSSLDFSGSDFKALVVEYMPNESLDSWLHPNANEDEHHQLKNLSLVQRLNVAIDISCALDYLHNHCEEPIIHCDLKPSNVLLDDDMVAHVSDFGLARILSEDIDYSQSQTNSLAIKGTIGYVAPEYGMGANTSTSGDVYSYGIVLLEMLTGKRPSDDMFANNMSLHQFAKMALPERVMEIIDHRLLAEEEIEIIRHSENYDKIRSMMQESLISLVKIGVSCSCESPKERMEMKDVVIEMQKVRDFYLRR